MCATLRLPQLEGLNDLNGTNAFLEIKTHKYHTLTLIYLCPLRLPFRDTKAPFRAQMPAAPIWKDTCE